MILLKNVSREAVFLVVDQQPGTQSVVLQFTGYASGGPTVFTGNRPGRDCIIAAGIVLFFDQVSIIILS